MINWWRNLRRRFAEWRKWRAIERAERLVWAHGYGVYHRAYVDEAYKRVASLKDYAERSGHLTRGFHAGKRVQRDAADVVELLYAGGVGAPPQRADAAASGVLAGQWVRRVVRVG